MRSARRSIPARVCMFKGLKTAVIEPKSIFLPNGTLRPDQYWLAIGIVAAIDTLRLSLVPTGMVQTVLITLAILAFVHINRLRDAGRSPRLVSAPILLGLAGKIIVASVAFFFAAMPVLEAYLTSIGVDINDTTEVNRAIMAPEFQEDFNAFMTADTGRALELIRAMAWPSHWGFWIVIGIVGQWFSRLPSAAR